MLATVGQSSPETSNWTRAEITIHGVRLSYIERDTAGPASGPPILLLHGLVAGGECFQPLAEHLPAGHRMVALDLPGGGYSDRPSEGDTSFRGIAELIADLIPALGMSRPILIGHSYGGAITLELSTRHPDLLDAMILIAPAHPFSGREDAIIRFYLTWPGRWLAHLIPRLPSRLMLEGFRRMPGDHSNLCYDQLQSYIQTLRHPRAVPYLLGLLRSWKRDMRRLAKALKKHRAHVPALLIWGDRDPVVPAFTAKALMRYLGPAEQAILPGVGHLPNLERPEQCGEVIRCWLGRRENYCDQRSSKRL